MISHQEYLTKTLAEIDDYDRRSLIEELPRIIQRLLDFWPVGRPVAWKIEGEQELQTEHSAWLLDGMVGAWGYGRSVTCYRGRCGDITWSIARQLAACDAAQAALAVVAAPPRGMSHARTADVLQWRAAWARRTAQGLSEPALALEPQPIWDDYRHDEALALAQRERDLVCAAWLRFLARFLDPEEGGTDER